MIKRQKIQVLNVYLHNVLVGELTSDRGTLSFHYHEDYLQNPNAQKVSAALPLRSQVFDHADAYAYFSGLLPDESVRYRLAKYLGLSERNSFSLLAVIGGECAGAVSLRPPKANADPIKGSDNLYRILGDDEANDILSSLQQMPMLAGEEGIRISGAGAQDKLMVAFVDGQLAIPQGDAPSTHIIKPAISYLDQSVQNEFFCMRLALKLGLKAPKVAILWVTGKPYYLIERYDRIQDGDKHWLRLHQEDFCQALGMPPEIKYESEGGPNVSDCFAFLDHRIKSGQMNIKAKLDLFRYLLFHFLIGNGDAHAKNFSILYLSGSEELAPVYDALCTMIYGHENKARLAMKIGGSKRFQFVALRHWLRLGKSAGLDADIVINEIKSMSSHIVKISYELASELNKNEETASPVYGDICQVIESRSKQCQPNQN